MKLQKLLNKNFLSSKEKAILGFFLATKDADENKKFISIKDFLENQQSILDDDEIDSLLDFDKERDEQEFMEWTDVISFILISDSSAQRFFFATLTYCQSLIGQYCKNKKIDESLNKTVFSLLSLRNVTIINVIERIQQLSFRYFMHTFTTSLVHFFLDESIEPLISLEFLDYIPIIEDELVPFIEKSGNFNKELSPLILTNTYTTRKKEIIDEAVCQFERLRTRMENYEYISESNKQVFIDKTDQLFIHTLSI